MKHICKFSAHYISGTHWDREWYRPFQEFRFLLVKLMDDLIDQMEADDQFRYFQLDGQTCMLEDYLEIHPENRPRLERLIRAGRILIGPWYTMPDLFCVGDEALIRNLLLGRRIAHQWGVEPMPVGFVCDMFGHPSQLPQILAGFGYRDCVLGRGTNEHTTPAFFHWESPDGTRAFAYKLQDAQGYGAFALPRAVMENPDTVGGSQLAQVDQFRAELEQAAGDPARLTAVREKWVRTELARYINHETQRANGPVIAVMDSMDHNTPATDVAGYLRLIREACPQVIPQHSSLPAFFAEARKRSQALPVKRGELREPSRNRSSYLWLIPNCVSARVRVKQANDHCQNLLEKWVEPLLALANARSPRISQRFLDVAWKHVLTNHAHDSICGCSIDQVHRDMRYRFDQAQIIGDQLRHQSIAVLTEELPDLARNKDEFTVVLVNPLPEPRDEVVRFDLDLPLDFPAEFREGFSGPLMKSFVLETAAGDRIPHQRLADASVVGERSRFARFSFLNDGPFVRCQVAARVALPACGVAALRVKPATHPVRAVGTLRTGPASAANEFLEIAIDPNGTLRLTDKTTGQTYPNLLMFESRSEVGDGWFHSHAINDEVALSTASAIGLTVMHDGPEIVTFRSTVVLRIPQYHDASGERPAPPLVEVTISNCISLRRGARCVEIETVVNNTAADHRLRVLLPSGAARAKTYFAHHPFDFVERPIQLDRATADWQEMEQAEKPFLGLQAVGDAQRGLAFICGTGLHEGGVVDDAVRTMQVTLLRSFRKTVGTAGEPDGLEAGKITYRYAILPYAGKLPRVHALRELARLQTGLATRQTGKRPSGFPPLPSSSRPLPPPPLRGLVELQKGNLVISAIKPPEQGDGLILRLWNPTGQRQTASIRFWKKIVSAQRTRLDETPEPGASVTVRGATVRVSAAPHQILTLQVKV